MKRLCLAICFLLGWSVFETPRSEAVPSSALITAAGNGDVARVKALLEDGADPNAQDEFGNTALMSAAINNDPPMGKYTAVVEALLAAGANPDIQHRIFGHTALMSAITNGDIPTIKALLAGGADRNLRDMNGRTALDRARDLEDEVPGLIEAFLP